MSLVVVIRERYRAWGQRPQETFDSVFHTLASNQGWRQEFSDGGADSSDEGAKIWFSWYYKCQVSEKFHLPTGRLACSDGGYSPLALPWRHLCSDESPNIMYAMKGKGLKFCCICFLQEASFNTA